VLDNASLFSPFQTFLPYREFVRDGPYCLEDGNTLGTDGTQPGRFIVDLTMLGDNNIQEEPAFQAEEQSRATDFPTR
jgi:hypothetical protein